MESTTACVRRARGGILRWACGLVGLLVACSAHAQMELNCARLDELQRLRGVGPALAARIVQARARQPFADWDDFERRVAGIGPRTAEALSLQGLRIGGRSYGMHRATDGGSSVPPAASHLACPRSPGPAAPARAAAPRPSRAAAPEDYPFLPGLSAPR